MPPPVDFWTANKTIKTKTMIIRPAFSPSSKHLHLNSDKDKMRSSTQQSAQNPTNSQRMNNEKSSETTASRGLLSLPKEEVIKTVVKDLEEIIGDLTSQMPVNQPLVEEAQNEIRTLRRGAQKTNSGAARQRTVMNNEHQIHEDKQQFNRQDSALTNAKLVNALLEDPKLSGLDLTQRLAMQTEAGNSERAAKNASSGYIEL